MLSENVTYFFFQMATNDTIQYLHNDFIHRPAVILLHFEISLG